MCVCVCIWGVPHALWRICVYMHMCVCVYMCVCVCVRERIREREREGERERERKRKRKSVCVCACVCVCMCVCVYICVMLNINSCVRRSWWGSHFYGTHVYICTCIYICMPIVYVQVYAYIWHEFFEASRRKILVLLVCVYIHSYVYSMYQNTLVSYACIHLYVYNM